MRDFERHVAATLRELELKHEALAELTAERFRSNAEALRLQTKELERRLEHLNGEQARMDQERTKFLPRELFESFKAQLASQTIAVIVGLLGVAAALIVYFRA